MSKDRENSNEEPASFPLDKFPGFIQDLVRESRDKKNFPEEITASAILSAIGGSIGNSLSIRTPEYEDRPITWICIVSPRGTLKTHAINRALNPIGERVSQDYKKHEREFQIWEISDGERKRPNFVPPLIHDSTIEGVYNALKHNPHGVITHADELSTWAGNFGRYSGGDDSGGYNSLFNGNQFILNRKNSSRSLYIDKPFWSIIGGLQPNLLSSLFGGDKIESGFFDRVQFVFPRDTDFQPMNGDPMPAKIWGEYDRGINLVLDEALSWTPDEWRYLRINDLEYWKTGYNALGLLRKGLDPNDPRRGLSSKAQTMFSRWALIAHGLNVAFNGKAFLENIAKEELETAYSLSMYFYKSGIQAYEMATNSSPLDQLSTDKRMLYDRIPHGLDFERKDALRIAEDLERETRRDRSPFKMSRASVDRFLARNDLFRITTYGNYLRLH